MSQCELNVVLEMPEMPDEEMSEANISKIIDNLVQQQRINADKKRKATDAFNHVCTAAIWKALSMYDAADETLPKNLLVKIACSNTVQAHLEGQRVLDAKIDQFGATYIPAIHTRLRQSNIHINIRLICARLEGHMFVANVYLEEFVGNVYLE